MELIPPLRPEEEAALEAEVSAALERVREDRDAKIQKEIEECPECDEVDDLRASGICPTCFDCHE